MHGVHSLKKELRFVTKLMVLHLVSALKIMVCKNKNKNYCIIISYTQPYTLKEIIQEIV